MIPIINTKDKYFLKQAYDYLINEFFNENEIVIKNNTIYYTSPLPISNNKCAFIEMYLQHLVFELSPPAFNMSILSANALEEQLTKNIEYNLSEYDVKTNYYRLLKLKPDEIFEKMNI